MNALSYLAVFFLALYAMPADALGGRGDVGQVSPPLQPQVSGLNYRYTITNLKESEDFIERYVETKCPILIWIHPQDDLTHLPRLITILIKYGVKEFAVCVDDSQDEEDEEELIDLVSYYDLRRSMYPSVAKHSRLAFQFYEDLYKLQESLKELPFEPFPEEDSLFHEFYWVDFTSSMKMSYYESTPYCFATQNNSAKELFVALYLRIDDNPEVKRHGKKGISVKQAMEVAKQLQKCSQEIRFPYVIQIRDSWTARVRCFISPYGGKRSLFFEDPIIPTTQFVPFWMFSNLGVKE